MKKLVQEEKHEYSCDLTGRDIPNGANYVGGEIAMTLLCRNEGLEKSYRESYKENGWSKKLLNDTIHMDCYSYEYLNLDMSQEVAIEVFNFLKEKYPKKLKHFNPIFTTPVKAKTK